MTRPITSAAAVYHTEFQAQSRIRPSLIADQVLQRPGVVADLPERKGRERHELVLELARGDGQPQERQAEEDRQ